MRDSILSARYFQDEKAAYDFVEARLWPNGPVCPHCGEKVHTGKLNGKSYRVGLHKCYACRKPFTVKIGTIFEDSHLRMHQWLQAIYLMASSKKGISSNQLQRTLDVTIKTAWFVSHRIREAMREGVLFPFGSGGGIVEVDETFIGKEEDKPKKRSFFHKQKVLSLLDRERRETRSMVIDNVTSAEIFPILNENIAREARIMTDDASQYTSLRIYFRKHEKVNHRRGEYVNPLNKVVHVKTIESYFSLFKRGMRGIYQHCKKQHLHRYLAEFDFRYNNRIAKGVDDVSRADALLKGVVGKRLTYQTTH